MIIIQNELRLALGSRLLTSILYVLIVIVATVQARATNDTDDVRINTQSRVAPKPVLGTSKESPHVEPAAAGENSLDEFEAVGREFERMQRRIERELEQNIHNSRTSFHATGPIAAPHWNQHISDMPKAMLIVPIASVLPVVITKPSSFTSAWNSTSSEAWSQNGSRFRFETTVRGIIVRLTGRVVQHELTIEKFELAISPDRKWSSYANIAEVPEPYRDEVAVARSSASNYATRQ